MTGCNFAYVDEEAKRIIRRAILEGLAIPGYEVPIPAEAADLPDPSCWAIVSPDLGGAT